MNFKEWWTDEKLHGSTDYYYGDARYIWNKALDSCAEMLEKEAAGLAIVTTITSSSVMDRLEATTKQTALLNAVIKIREEIANS